MTIKEFIELNKVKLIEKILSKGGDNIEIDDESIEQWIDNDEELYLWAIREGVKIY